MLSKRAQEAIEFTAMLGVLLLLFAGLLAFVSAKYGAVFLQKDSILLKGVLDDLANEIRLALFAPDGYERTFLIRSTATGSAYEVSIRNSAELHINSSSGLEQIYFLRPDEYVRGNICVNSNQILKSVDYGIALCCNSCNGSIPGVNYSLAIECKTNTSSYWDDCNNMTSGSYWDRLRINCSLWMVGASTLKVYNQTDGALLTTGISASTQTDVRNTSISWVTYQFTAPITVRPKVYNISAICYNSTAAYFQRANFTIS